MANRCQFDERAFLLALLAEIEAMAQTLEPPLSRAELLLLEIADQIEVRGFGAFDA